jgi:hypothetical protein
MRKKAYIAIVIFLLALGATLVPYRTVLVPKWRVQLVNKQGVPYAGEMVDQICEHYTYDVNPCLLAADDIRRYTDENGYVEYSEKSFSLSLMSRIVRACKSYFLLIAHGSVGPVVYLQTEKAGYRSLKYEPGRGAPPERWVIPSEK